MFNQKFPHKKKEKIQAYLGCYLYFLFFPLQYEDNNELDEKKIKQCFNYNFTSFIFVLKERRKWIQISVKKPVFIFPIFISLFLYELIWMKKKLQNKYLHLSDLKKNWKFILKFLIFASYFCFLSFLLNETLKRK